MKDKNKLTQPRAVSKYTMLKILPHAQRRPCSGARPRIAGR